MEYRRIRFAQIGAGEVVSFAVAELKKYLKKMDPALFVDVLLTEKYDLAYENVVWVGLDEELMAHVPMVEDPALDDAYAYRVKNGRGWITGSNERSVLQAAYRFLQALGCAFVRPGEEGERIPRLELAHINVQKKGKASARHRGVCIEGADTYENIADMIDFLPKLGMNEYYIQFWVPSEFFERWYKHESNPYLQPENITRQDVVAMTGALEREIAKRGLGYHKTGHGWTCEPFGIDGTSWNSEREYPIPEETVKYLAEVQGKRALWGNVPLNTNLCYSNPEVRAKITDAITSYCIENPHVGTLHFWLADGRNNHCECDACRKMRPADWYVKMLNELDEKMTAAGLSTKVVFLIYVDLLWAPVQEKIANPDRFILMFAPITRYYGTNYGDCTEYAQELPPYERNALSMPRSLEANLAHLREWQKQFSGDSFSFDYHLMWIHIADPGYAKCARNLFQDMKDLKKIGLGGMMSCQIQRAFFPSALPFVAMATALWDENADFAPMAEQYYSAAFGEDGNLAQEYLESISDLFLTYEMEAKEPPFCKNYDAVRALVAGFAPVIEKNAAIAGPCQQEWQHLKLHGEYVLLLASCLESIEQGKMDACMQNVGMLFDYLNRSEMALQKVLDVHNVQIVVKNKLFPKP